MAFSTKDPAKVNRTTRSLKAQAPVLLLAALLLAAACSLPETSDVFGDPKTYLDDSPAGAAVFVFDQAKLCEGTCLVPPFLPQGNDTQNEWLGPFPVFTTESTSAPGPTLDDLPDCPEGFDTLDIGSQHFAPSGDLCPACPATCPIQAPPPEALTCNPDGVAALSPDACGEPTILPHSAPPITVLASARACVPRPPPEGERDPAGSCSDPREVCVARPPGSLACVVRSGALGCPTIYPAVYPLLGKGYGFLEDTRHCECGCVPDGKAACSGPSAPNPGGCYAPSSMTLPHTPVGQAEITGWATLCCTYDWPKP
jgi:hypothetical protein